MMIAIYKLGRRRYASNLMYSQKIGVQQILSNSFVKIKKLFSSKHHVSY